MLDPDDGYVVTANQAVPSENYPYYLGSTFDYGYRSQRIRTSADQGGERSRSTTCAHPARHVQRARHAADAVPARVSTSTDSYYRVGQKLLLQGWDFTMDAGLRAGRLLQRRVGQAARRHVPRRPARVPGRTATRGGGPSPSRRCWTTRRTPFWDDGDTDEVETRDDISEAADEGRDELTRLLSRDPHRWEWGKLHQLELVNPTLGSNSSPVRFMFNRGRTSSAAHRRSSTRSRGMRPRTTTT